MPSVVLTGARQRRTAAARPEWEAFAEAVALELSLEDGTVRCRLEHVPAPEARPAGRPASCSRRAA